MASVSPSRMPTTKPFPALIPVARVARPKSEGFSRKDRYTTEMGSQFLPRSSSLPTSSHRPIMMRIPRAPKSTVEVLEPRNLPSERVIGCPVTPNEVTRSSTTPDGAFRPTPARLSPRGGSPSVYRDHMPPATSPARSGSRRPLSPCRRGASYRRPSGPLTPVWPLPIAYGWRSTAMSTAPVEVRLLRFGRRCLTRRPMTSHNAHPRQDWSFGTPLGHRQSRTCLD